MKNRGVDKTPAVRAPGLLAQWICVFSRRQNQVVNPTEVTVVEAIKRHPFQAAARTLAFVTSVRKTTAFLCI